MAKTIGWWLQENSRATISTNSKSSIKSCEITHSIHSTMLTTRITHRSAAEFMGIRVMILVRKRRVSTLRSQSTKRDISLLMTVVIIVRQVIRWLTLLRKFSSMCLSVILSECFQLAKMEGCIKKVISAGRLLMPITAREFSPINHMSSRISSHHIKRASEWSSTIQSWPQFIPPGTRQKCRTNQ